MAPRAPAAAPLERTGVLRFGEGAWLGLPKDACSLEAALQRELGSVEAVNCGTLPRFALASMRMAAQQCVLAAQAAGRAYRVSYQPPSYDSRESAGIVSKGVGTSAVSLQKSSTPGGPYWQWARLGMHHCSEVVAMQSCDLAQGDLCLNCMAVGLGHALCEEKEAL